MLETLLESKARKGRSAGGAMVSVAGHTLVIAAAVYATAQARPAPERPREVISRFYVPRSPAPTPRAVPAAPRQAPPVGRALIFVEPKLSVDVPPIDVIGSISKPDDFGATAIGGASPVSGGEVGGGGYAAPLRADQVERQVAVVPGAAPPRYPEVLRSAGIEGQVTAQFVVDEQGRSEEESVRFLRSDNRLFEDAVLTALRRMRFIPAEVGGRKVRQLVQMPFVFTLSR
jgi:protein TonB